MHEIEKPHISEAIVDKKNSPLMSLNRPTHLLGLLLCGGSAEKVKVNLEPFVDAGVNCVVLVADLLRCQALFSGFVLCSCAVLICATHKQHVPASQTAIPRKGSGENTYNDYNDDKNIYK